MAPRKPSKTKLLLTQRALRDFAEIESYSIEQRGKRTASRYVSDLEAGLERIRENPELLHELAPTLSLETELLHRKLQQSKKR